MHPEKRAATWRIPAPEKLGGIVGLVEKTLFVGRHYPFCSSLHPIAITIRLLQCKPHIKIPHMVKYTRQDVKKLTPAIIKEFHEAGQHGDVQAFKRLLGRYASHLSQERKEELIEEFKRNADALRANLRKQL